MNQKNAFPTLFHQVTLPTLSESIEKSQLQVCESLQKLGFTKEFVNKIKLVLGESLSNAVEHAGSGPGKESIKLTVNLSGDSLQIKVEDFQGKMFDPEFFRRIAAAKDWGKGGRGIMLLEAIMDHVAYLIDEGRHTILFLEKRIHAQDLIPKDTKTSEPS